MGVRRLSPENNIAPGALLQKAINSYFPPILSSWVMFLFGVFLEGGEEEVWIGSLLSGFGPGVCVLMLFFCSKQ